MSNCLIHHTLLSSKPTYTALASNVSSYTITEDHKYVLACGIGVIDQRVTAKEVTINITNSRVNSTIVKYSFLVVHGNYLIMLN